MRKAFVIIMVLGLGAISLPLILCEEIISFVNIKMNQLIETIQEYGEKIEL
jgi:hypothetical protein